MSKILNRTKGAFGEDLAVRFLCTKGFRVLERNWTCRWGELDAVCIHNSVLVFVEVKYKSSDRYGSAFEALDYKKKKHLLKTIRYYLLRKSHLTALWRLDAVCLTGGAAGGIDIKHYENIELPYRS